MVRRKLSYSNSLHSAVDIFEAVRRAFLRKGLIRAKPTFKVIPKPKRELQRARKKSHEILFRTDTVFPFTLFPDTIILDREKLTIINRHFFWVATINSTPIRDALSVTLNLGPFFGSLQISSRYFSSNPYSMNYLWRSDAIKLRHLIQGYIIVEEQEIDCSKIAKGELITMLLDLGRGEA